MAPGAMKWVPVNKSEDPIKPEKPERVDKAEETQSRPKGKGDPKGAGKGEAKGTGKSDARGGGKAEAKGAGKAEKGVEKGISKAEPKGGKGKAVTAKGDSKGLGKGDGNQEKAKAESKGIQKGEQRVEAKSEAKSGGKGRGEKGKGKPTGKGKGTKKGDELPQPQASSVVKTVQEVEAEMAKNQAAKPFRRARGSDAVGKQPIDAKGQHCVVRKHSGMGCAVVTMESGTAREVVMQYVEKKSPPAAGSKPKTEIGCVVVQLQRHQDKQSQREVVTDIFVAWGHRAEKESPLAVEEIAEAFDKLYVDANTANAQKGPPPVPPAAQTPAAATLPSGQVGTTLSTTPQQLLAGRPPAVPPPPMHLPTVGAQGVPAPQAPVHAAYYEYAQRAMFNNWMANPAMNPYFAQQQQQQQATHSMYAHHQQAAAAALDYQRHIHQLQQQQLQMQQIQQQQKQLPIQPQQIQQQRPQQPAQQPPQQSLQQPPQAPQQLHLQQIQQPQPFQVPQTPPAQAMQSEADAPTTPSGTLEAPAGGVMAVGTLPPATPPRSGASNADGQPVVPAAMGLSPDYAPAKPRLLPIVDPNSGQTINTLSMNFEPRKPSSPLQIINPSSGEAVNLEQLHAVPVALDCPVTNASGCGFARGTVNGIGNIQLVEIVTAMAGPRRPHLAAELPVWSVAFGQSAEPNGRQPVAAMEGHIAAMPDSRNFVGGLALHVHSQDGGRTQGASILPAFKCVALHIC
eukprot:CAMPEP_0179078962 /NCGR_PEP_ID=MMETSP0796-20121207/35399_1 /TAXON_ID=73915 /ORGANISM="Pyrodinium bahamense, Strain pbaha01" /LENGTH=735 /DNA_ID=CAMNT_0020776287 /DNA_START=87 /DNA_END=2296 /DNA_ORIENTATION=+